VQDVVETVTGTITYDSLGSLYSTYEDLPAIPYDSAFWSSNSPVLGYMATDNKLKSLSGSASSMTLTTGWFGDEASMSVCTRVRPRMRTPATSATITSQSVRSLGDPASIGTTSTLHDGRFDVLQCARYHRFAMTFTGSCEVEAIAPTLKESGRE